MSKIKIKENKKGTIKTLDKAIIGTQKIKDKMINSKTNIKENINNNSETNYATDRIIETSQKLPKKIYKFNRKGKENFNQAKSKIVELKIKIRNDRLKDIERNSTPRIKTKQKDIDFNINSKIREEKNNLAIRTAEKSLQIAKLTARKTAIAVTLSIKAVIKIIKTIIASINTLLIFLTAGLWLVVIIIIIICLIGMICGSIFGIFLSSETTESVITVDGVTQPVTMSDVIANLNSEFINKITTIQKENPYNEYDIVSSRASWKDVLAIYTVKTSGGNNETEVMTLNDEKVETLKTIFWEMNEISFSKEEETHEEIKIGWTSTERITVTTVKLHIKVTSKTADEMAEEYNFTEEQKSQLSELLKDDYSTMWTSVIYGSSIGSSDIVKVAESQIGNVGGEPYWSWYGYDNRVEWCACFVSWCANECGYIEAGIIPKFASCQAEGVEWFKTCGLWQDNSYIPKSGDIIFFDWENDGHSDHVGIVKKIENNKIYTIEGNSNEDTCREKEYNVSSNVIMGYGIPIY